ncbi:hypothetical protein QE152_g13035 [Popillia japonica]|uniref:Peptidase S1 domain-containing protein n=1 Tax=Popillia japonica TaxID=7064 RepID=A0AAW1LB53_POPJA
MVTYGSTQQLKKITDIKVHPNYQNSRKYNLALVQVNSNFDYGEASTYQTREVIGRKTYVLYLATPLRLIEVGDGIARKRTECVDIYEKIGLAHEVGARMSCMTINRRECTGPNGFLVIHDHRLVGIGVDGDKYCGDRYPYLWYATYFYVEFLELAAGWRSTNSVVQFAAINRSLLNIYVVYAY